jgi:hypothetical protein
MDFHLTHIIPDPRMHGLNGYKEVIDSVKWALRQLGHTAEYGVNVMSKKATNVVFGAQMLPEDVVRNLPPQTIVYNFEQICGVANENVRPSLRAAATHLMIWDYSEANIEKWKLLGASRFAFVPVGYAPILKRIPSPKEQDIDVLIYGRPGDDRLNAFNHVASSGLTVVFVCGMYGKSRDGLIGRSKLILNQTYHQHSKIFEIVRVSYLLANQKAVIAVIDGDTHIEQDIRACVKISSPQDLVSDCLRLVNDPGARKRLERDGWESFSRRDVRNSLKNALSGAT